jgi:hypothetical protein
METQESRLMQAALSDLIASGYIPNTAKLRLFTDPPANSPTLVLADFTEAGFTGYLAVTLSSTWLEGLDGAARGIEKYNGLASFICTAVSGPDTVYGWYITDGAGAALFAYGFFDAPVVIGAIGDQITVVPFIYQLMLADAEQEFLAGP